MAKVKFRLLRENSRYATTITIEEEELPSYEIANKIMQQSNNRERERHKIMRRYNVSEISTEILNKAGIILAANTLDPHEYTITLHAKRAIEDIMDLVLTQKQREIINSYYFEKEPMEMIAAKENIRPNTAYNHLNAGILNIKDFINKHEELKLLLLEFLKILTKN